MFYFLTVFGGGGGDGAPFVPNFRRLFFHPSAWCRHCIGSVSRNDWMAGIRESGRQGNSSAAINRCADMQGVNIFIDHVTCLQYGADTLVHIVCIQNTKNPGELQRSQIHWFHHVFNVHRLAGIFTDLFRNQ